MQYEQAKRVLAALLQKTVARGCTPAEAESAAAKAREIAAHHGIDLAVMRAEQERPPRAYTVNDAVEDMLRRYRQAAAENLRRRQEAARQAQAAEAARHAAEQAAAQEAAQRKQAQAAAQAKAAQQAAPRGRVTPGTRFDAAEAVRLFMKGMSVPDIAMRFGYEHGHGQNRVRNALMRAGVYTKKTDK